MKVIKLPIYGIALYLRNGTGQVESDLHRTPKSCECAACCWDGNGGAERQDISEHNATMRGIENLILRHALAGVDVEDPAYLEGITRAVDG